MEECKETVEQSAQEITSHLPKLDEKTLEILKEIHKEMEYEDPVVDEDINWQEINQGHQDPVELIIEKVYTFKDKICKKFKKSKEVVQDLLPGRTIKLKSCE